MPESDCDTDTDPDSENAFPSALIGSQPEAPGLAGGYSTRIIHEASTAAADPGMSALRSIGLLLSASALFATLENYRSDFWKAASPFHVPYHCSAGRAARKRALPPRASGAPHPLHAALRNPCLQSCIVYPLFANLC